MRISGNVCIYISDSVYFVSVVSIWLYWSTTETFYFGISSDTRGATLTSVNPTGFDSMFSFAKWREADFLSASMCLFADRNKPASLFSALTSVGVLTNSSGERKRLDVYIYIYMYRERCAYMRSYEHI